MLGFFTLHTIVLIQDILQSAVPATLIAEVSSRCLAVTLFQRLTPSAIQLVVRIPLIVCPLQSFLPFSLQTLNLLISGNFSFELSDFAADLANLRACGSLTSVHLELSLSLRLQSL